MNKTLPLLFLSLLSSCVLFSPNPNRESMLSTAPLELKPFTTDYCTDWPNGTKARPNMWADCCFTHDLNYWLGGTEAERKNADEGLKECVKSSGASVEGSLMYMGVRMGGKPGDESYSWGYGWTIRRDYQKMPVDDLEKAENLLKSSGYNQQENTQKLINNFIDVLDKRIHEN